MFLEGQFHEFLAKVWTRPGLTAHRHFCCFMFHICSIQTNKKKTNIKNETTHSICQIYSITIRKKKC